MCEKFWNKGFKDGSFLSRWNGYSPTLIGGLYSNNMGIGEDKFNKCMGWFSGIGDVDWWIKEELDKLTKEETHELRIICAYKEYINDFITQDLV